MEDLVLIARILKPHGITGEIAIESYTNDERRFEHLDRVFIRDNRGSVSEKSVESSRLTAKGILLKLASVDDRDAAEALRNMEVLIPENERPKLPEGSAYYDEIAGMTVIDDESGEALGKVVEVIEAPAGEVFVLDLQGKEHLVTNAGEEVRKVDTKKKELRVKLLPEY